MQCEYCYEVKSDIDNDICLDCQEDYLCKECYTTHGFVIEQEPICLQCNHISDIDTLKMKDLVSWLTYTLGDEILINPDLSRQILESEDYLYDIIVPQFTKKQLLHFVQNNSLDFDSQLLPQTIIHSVFLRKLGL